MTLIFDDPNGEFFAPFGTVTQALTGMPARGGLGYDPFIFWTNGSLVECGVLPVSTLIGSYFNHGEPRRYRLDYEKPHKIPYSAQHDSGLWANAINSIPVAYQTLVTGSFPDFNPGKEHRTSHLSYQGEIGPNVVWDPLHQHLGDNQTYDFGVWPRFHDSVGYQQTPSLNPFDVVYFDGSGYPLVRKGGISSNPPPMATLRERRSSWSEYLSIPRRWNWSGYCPYVTILYNYTDLTASDSLGLHVSYTYVWATMDQGGFYDSVGQPRYEEVHYVDLRITPRTNVPAATFSALSDTWYNIMDMGGVDIDVVDNFASARDFGPGYPTYGPSFGCPSVGTITKYHWHFGGSVLVAHPSAGDGNGLSSSFSWKPFLEATKLRAFDKAVNSASGDILASAYISASNALQESPLIASNLIEAGNEWQNVDEFLPDLSEGLKLIRSLASGDVLATGYDYIKLLTGLELYYDFGLNPNIQAVKQILPVIRKTGDLFASINRTYRKYYGKFHFQFPQGEFGRDLSFLDTRTLVIVPSDKNSLEGLLNLASLGVAPLPHMFWATLPFSFVVDWYLAIGPKMKAMSFALLGSTLMDTKVVHTFRVSTPVTQSELDLIPAKNRNLGFGSEQPRMQVFHRDVSRWFPAPRESKYDFLLNHFPPWQIAASLAIQLAF